ncbi:MAG TPA: hypothetical protein VIJ93_00655 [bacterium]
MKRSINLRSAFFSWGLPLFLLLMVSPGFSKETVPTLEPTPAETPLETLGTGLGPDLSAVDLSYDTKAFLQRARGLYYNYNPRGLKQFRCQVDDDAWDQILKVLLLEEMGRQMDKGENGELGSDSTSKKIKNLKFLLTYTHEEGFKFSREDFTNSGNPQYDKLADQMTEVVGKEVLLFSDAWDGVLGMKKPPKAKPEYKVVKGPKGYTVSETKEGQTWVWLFQESGLLSESWTPSSVKNGEDLHLGFSFKKVSGGYLPTVITFDIRGGEVSGELQVDYEDAGNFKMPKKVFWNCEYPGKEKDKKTTADSLAFFNYQVNGTPVESPLPQQPSMDAFYVLQQAFNEAFHAGFEFHVGFGPFLSDSLPVNHYSGYNGTFGLGWEISRSFSLSFEYQGADYKTSDKIYDLYFDELMLLGKYRLFTGDFRPYLFGGLGVGISEYFPDGVFPIQTIAHDTNIVGEVGVGFEVQVAKNFFLFAQTSYVDNQLSPSFTQSVAVENPFHFVPLQFGIAFER